MASRPARSFTAALGIAVGIATVLSVQVIDHNTILTQERQKDGDQLGRRDVEMKPVKPGLPEGGAAPVAFANEPDLESFCGYFYNQVTLTGASAGAAAKGGKRAQTEATIVGIGRLAAEEFDSYALEEGRDFSSMSAAETLLPERTAVELGLQVGDKLSLEAATPAREGCIDGKIVTVEGKGKRADVDALPDAPKEFAVVGVLRPVNLGAQPVIVLPFESGATLFKGAHLQPVYWGKLKPGAVHQDVIERLKQDWIVEKPKLAMVGERIDQKAFRKSLGITSCLALLLGLFVIYNAFSLALVERVREIGLLRAIGLTRGEIARAILLEGFLLALFGALLGIALSAGLVTFMKVLHITTLGAGKPIEILEIPWGVTAGVIALGMLFALLGMGAPLLRARHLSVIEALRAGRLALRTDPGFSLRVGLLLGGPLLIPLFFTMVTPPLGERQTAVQSLIIELSGVVAAFFVLLLAFPGPIHRVVEWTLAPLKRSVPIESRLAQSAVRGARQRILATLTGLSVVVAAVFCVRAVNHGFLDEVGRFSDTSMGGRIYVRTRATPKAQADELLKLPGVVRVYSASADVNAPFPLRGMNAADVRANQRRLGLTDAGMDDFANGNAILLSRFLAEQYDWKLGDAVNLPTFAGSKTFRVGAISDALGYWPDDRSFAVIEMGRMDQLFCRNDAESKNFVVELDENADADALEAALLARVEPTPDRQVRSATTIKRSYLLDGRRDFYVFDVILWMTALLAAVGLLNSLAIALLERGREIGLLRTIGVTARQVARMLLFEALAIGVVGGLLACALTVPVSMILLEAVRVISRLELRWRFDPINVAAPFVAAVAIAAFAGLWPALHSGKLRLGPLHRHD